MLKPGSRTLAELIDEMSQRYGGSPAVTFGQETVTFAEFRSRARAFARALYADGVRKGDHVGILMGNRIEWLVVNFAIQYLGATMVAMNTWYTAPELAYVLNHGDVSVLIAADRFLKADYVDLLGELDVVGSEAFPRLRRVVIMGRDVSRPGWMTYDDYLREGEAAQEEAIDHLLSTVTEDDIAYILYTSGSTSKPKGVMLTHLGLLGNAFNIGERLHLDADDALFLPVSLFWGLGCENALPAAWTHGMHIILQHNFDPVEALDLIERHRCTTFYSTSNVTLLLFEHENAGQRDLTSLRKGMGGGSRKVIEQYLPLGCRAYGMTETYGYATVNDASDPAEKRISSMGRPTPGNTLRIHHPDTGEVLPTGETGELRIRGHVFKGYYKNPEITAQSFDDEGFFRTGDLGRFDEEGYFYFQGRLKEMLKTGGMNVSPAEVEDVLMLLPQVTEAYVTALPDAIRDQIVAAVLLVEQDANITEEQILEHCRTHLAAYKVPRHLRIVSRERLPVTTTGRSTRCGCPSCLPAEPSRSA